MKVGLESLSAVQISALRILSGAWSSRSCSSPRGGRLPTGCEGVGPPVRVRVLPRGPAVHAVRPVRDPDQLGARGDRQRRDPHRHRPRDDGDPAGGAGHRSPARRGRRRLPRRHHHHAAVDGHRPARPRGLLDGPGGGASYGIGWTYNRRFLSGVDLGGLSQPTATLLTALVLMVPVVLSWAVLQPEGLAAIWSYDTPDAGRGCGCRSSARSCSVSWVPGSRTRSSSTSSAAPGR